MMAVVGFEEGSDTKGPEGAAEDKEGKETTRQIRMAAVVQGNWILGTGTDS